MELIEKIVSMGRLSRNNHRLKTRQPLRELLVITQDPKDKKTIERFKGLIQTELNVKKVSFSSEESKWVSFSAKPNAKILGPRLGAKMKDVSSMIRALTHEQVSRLEGVGSIEVGGEKVSREEVVIERTPKQEGIIQSLGNVTIWLDSLLDEELVSEGRAREFVNRVQKLRKDMDLDVADRIHIFYEGESELGKAIERHGAYICSETLAVRLEQPQTEVGWSAEQEIDDMPLKLRIEKC